MDNKKKPSEAQSLGSSVMAFDPRLDIPTTAERLTKPLKDIKSTFITKFERLSTLIDDKRCINAVESEPPLYAIRIFLLISIFFVIRSLVNNFIRQH